MKSEIKSSQLETRAQIVQRELQLKRREIVELSNSRDRIQTTLQMQRAHFHQVLRGVRKTAENLSPKLEIHRSNEFAKKVSHLQEGLRQGQQKLAEISKQHHFLIDSIHAHKNATDRLNKEIKDAKLLIQNQQEDAEIDQLSCIKSAVLQNEAPSSANLSITIAPESGPKNTTQLSFDRNHLIEDKSQHVQRAPIEISKFDNLCDADTLALDFTSSQGIAYKVEIEEGVKGLNLRLSSDKKAASGELIRRRQQLKKNLERSGVRVDTVICG